MYNPKISKRKYIIAKQKVLSKIIKKQIFEKNHSLGAIWAFSYLSNYEGSTECLKNINFHADKYRFF